MKTPLLFLFLVSLATVSFASPPPKRDNPSKSVQDFRDSSNPAVGSIITYTITSYILPTPSYCSYIPSSKDCNTGCICSKSPSWSIAKSIYITNYTRLEELHLGHPAATVGPTYRITSFWILNFPNQLRYAFQEAGFAILPGPPFQCGWQTSGSFSAMGVRRGKIEVNGTIEYDQGNPAELAVIRSVLLSEYPFIEILVICAIFPGLICVSFGLCIWSFCKPANIPTSSRALYRRL